MNSDPLISEQQEIVKVLFEAVTLMNGTVHLPPSIHG